MTISGVMRTGEVCIRVMDLDAAREHYGERVGLIETLREDDGTTYYKAWDEHDLYSLVIRPSDHPGVEHVAFKAVDDATLTDVAAKLDTLGFPTTELPADTMPRSGRRFRFTLATGHEADLYAEKEQCGNGMPLRNPGTMPPPGTIRGMRVIRLAALTAARLGAKVVGRRPGCGRRSTSCMRTPPNHSRCPTSRRPAGARSVRCRRRSGGGSR